MKLKSLTFAGVAAALYTLLTLSGYGISFGPLQFRFSEALCILPLLFPETAIGLTVGCFLSNLIGGFGPWDVVLGTLATLIGSVGTLLCGKFLKKELLRIIFGVLCPVVANALIIPVVFVLTGTAQYFYFIEVLIMFATELGAVGVIGVPLYLALKKAFESIGNRKE